MKRLAILMFLVVATLTQAQSSTRPVVLSWTASTASTVTGYSIFSCAVATGGTSCTPSVTGIPLTTVTGVTYTTTEDAACDEAQRGAQRLPFGSGKPGSRRSGNERPLPRFGGRLRLSRIRHAGGSGTSHPEVRHRIRPTYSRVRMGPRWPGARGIAIPPGSPNEAFAMGGV